MKYTICLITGDFCRYGTKGLGHAYKGMYRFPHRFNVETSTLIKFLEFYPSNGTNTSTRVTLVFFIFSLRLLFLVSLYTVTFRLISLRYYDRNFYLLPPVLDSLHPSVNLRLFSFFLLKVDLGGLSLRRNDCGTKIGPLWAQLKNCMV